MTKLLRYNLLALLLLTLVWPLQSAVAAVEEEPAVKTWQESVAMQKYLIWQRINEARSNPLEALERLEIPLEEAQAVFGEDSAVLTDGLPPLAWNEQLDKAATLHARDMIEHVYYSYTSRDGSGPMERIAETGYQALSEDETLGALLFLNPIELDRGVTLLLDNIMRDELTGAAGVSRNVFSAELTEVGVSFDAETLPTLFDQPFVYLVVIDFAEPLTPRRALIGQYDVGSRVMMMSFANYRWSYLPMQLPGLFQITYPEGGAKFVVISDDEPNHVSTPVDFYDEDPVNNDFIDLRTEWKLAE